MMSVCGAPVADVSACQVAQLSFQLEAFGMVDMSAYSCANAGDFAALMPLLTQLSGLTAPMDICSAEAAACLADDEETP